MGPVSGETIQTPNEKMRGPVFLPGVLEYDGARAIWNAMIDKHPGVIERCSGVADVMHAVQIVKGDFDPIRTSGLRLDARCSNCMIP